MWYAWQLRQLKYFGETEGCLVVLVAPHRGGHLRMNEAAACLVDWQLAPFLRGLCEPPFAREVRDFVDRHAAAFAAPCRDGSCPLRWTQLHEEYSALFERQLKAVVQEEGFSLEDFREHMAQLREFAALRAPDDYLPGCEPSFIPPSPGIRVSEFWDFLEALTASKNFHSFKEVMQAAAQRPLEARGYPSSLVSLVPKSREDLVYELAQAEPGQADASTTLRG
ncbi:unnamed protein product [Symbiodinium natans]|uniref:BART domain-containing protein n=1 Tax=Symbiodinium natans TaxID=878477 RepID=A0A812UT47_9DINO|nr:unnamed protein product [Symbiodinium natans]